MREDTGLHCEQLRDLPHLRSDRVSLSFRQIHSCAFLNSILDEMVELPHQQRHVEGAPKGKAGRVSRKRRLQMQMGECGDRLAV